VNHHLREIADCLDEALRLQSRVMDLTEQVYEAAGMSPGDRTLRGKVTGLFFGLQAHLEELNRLAQDDARSRRCGREASMGCIEVARVGSRSAKSDLTS
jgi:hypothetical protein